jgi:hypothetical protein
MLGFKNTYSSASIILQGLNINAMSTDRSLPSKTLIVLHQATPAANEQKSTKKCIPSTQKENKSDAKLRVII